VPLNIVVVRVTTQTDHQFWQRATRILWTAIPAIIVLGFLFIVSTFNEIGGFSPHDIHDAPYTRGGEHTWSSDRGNSERFTSSTVPSPTSIRRNLIRQGLTQPRHQSAMMIKFPRSEMIQGRCFSHHWSESGSGRQTARICCKYNGYAVRLDCYYPDNGVVSRKCTFLWDVRF